MFSHHYMFHFDSFNVLGSVLNIKKIVFIYSTEMLKCIASIFSRCLSILMGFQFDKNSRELNNTIHEINFF